MTKKKKSILDIDLGMSKKDKERWTKRGEVVGQVTNGFMKGLFGRKEQSSTVSQTPNLSSFVISGQNGLSLEQVILNYQHPKRQKKELPYSMGLFGYIQGFFPDAKYEAQREIARPDIVIGNIAIEVKAPTTNGSLNTLPAKRLTYLPHFNRVIFVLFENRSSPQVYNAIIPSLKQDPRITVIEK